MLIKRIDDISSKTKDNKGYNNLSKLKIKPWKWTGEEWIIETAETSNNEVSND